MAEYSYYHSERKPPYQSTDKYRGKPDKYLIDIVRGGEKFESGKKSYKKEYYNRIAETQPESGGIRTKQIAVWGAYLFVGKLLFGVVGVDNIAEKQKYDTDYYLNDKAILLYKLDDDIHRKPYQYGVNDIWSRGSESCNKSV